jgi:hypothetical protein
MFYNVPEVLIEPYWESIRTWGLVMLHFKKRLHYFILSIRCRKMGVVLIENFWNILWDSSIEKFPSSSSTKTFL